MDSIRHPATVPELLRDRLWDERPLPQQDLAPDLRRQAHDVKVRPEPIERGQQEDQKEADLLHSMPRYEQAAYQPRLDVPEHFEENRWKSGSPPSNPVRDQGLSDHFSSLYKSWTSGIFLFGFVAVYVYRQAKK